MGIGVALALLAMGVRPLADPVPQGIESPLGLRAFDTEGTPHALRIRPGSKGLCLVLLALDCPVSNEAIPELNRLAALAREQDLDFLGWISDPFASPVQAEELRRTFGLGFPLLFDANGVLASRLRPRATPEAFVYDARGALVYRGRIDDRVRTRFDTNAPVRRDLYEALCAVAMAQPVAVPLTGANGCAYEGWGEPEMERLTWARHVAPILDLHCAGCHGDSGPAPFPLRTYEDAARRSKMIARVAVERTMPRWHAAPSFGRIADERTLDEREIRTLDLWSVGGAKRGNDADRLIPRPAGSMSLGAPDCTLPLAKEILVPAEGQDQRRAFRLPQAASGGSWIRAVGFRFSDSRAVRRARLIQGSFAPRGAGETDEEQSILPVQLSSPVGLLGQWLPGSPLDELPLGHARRLTHPAELVLWMHVHPTGVAQRVRVWVDLWLAEDPVHASVARETVSWTERAISNDAHGDYVVKAEKRLEVDHRLLGILPFMNRAGLRMSVSARLPDGVQLPLVTLDRWDPSWPERYRFSTPVDLPVATTIMMEARLHGGPEQTSLAPALAGLYASGDAGPAGCDLELVVSVLATDSSKSPPAGGTR